MEQAVKIAGDIIREILSILNESSPYVLFGLVISAVLKAFIPDEFVQKQLGGKGIGSVFKAAILGIPLPICSCGVIPVAMGLRKQGASRGATSAFLVSTPETGVDSIAVTYALIDPLMTIFRPIAAFVIAMITGILENIFSKGEAAMAFEPVGEFACCGCSAEIHEKTVEKPKITKRLKDGFIFTFGELLSDIGGWLLIGIAIAGVISYAVPDGFFARYLGGGIIPMLVMLVIGIPLYVCASSSTPLAAAMMLKGLSPGAALVFLIAGPATNAATIMVIGKTLGKRSLAIYLGSIAVCAIILGFILNGIYSGLHLTIAPRLGISNSESTGILGGVSSIILIALIIRCFIINRYGKTGSCEG